MRIALLTSSTNHIYEFFLSSYGHLLKANDIEINLVLIDDNENKSASPFTHAKRVASRQAKVAGCSFTMGFLKIIFYKLMTAFGHIKTVIPALNCPGSILTVSAIHVNTLNSEEATTAINKSNIDLICLMGTRIITRKTIEKMARPILNIHSSDPRFMRGSPSIVWEVLAGLDSITLTVHEVIEALDSGRIYLQSPLPISYSGGLGSTTKTTMASATPKIAELFFRTILEIKNQTIRPQEFTPGPLRVTPGLFQTVRAELICRKKTLARGLNK